MPQTKILFSNLHRIALALLMLLGLNSLLLRASHNTAGQFTYVKTGTNQYEITLTTYTDPSGAGVDRCTADFEIYSGGQIPVLIDVIIDVPRINGPGSPDPLFPAISCAPGIKMGEYVVGTIKKNIYIATYTFAGPGNFIISYTDHARIAQIINMSNPGGTAFNVSTLISNQPSLGQNDSPRFLNDPLDFACTGKIWTHNPGGFDPEGDSLVYFLIQNRKAPNTPVDNYVFPDQIGPGNNTFVQDPQTGLITWTVPAQIGAYNVAFIVEEYRNGVKIGEAVRDMAIFVEACTNDPPVIVAITDTCVTAGDTIEIPFIVYDPNMPIDSVYLELNNGNNGLNGPFAPGVNPPAQIIIDDPFGGVIPVGQRDTIKGRIRWITNCSHIRKQFYQVDLWAHDNWSYLHVPGGNPGSGIQMLSDHHVIKIFVTPPPVENLSLTTGPHQVTLNWNKYSCSNALGYHIYRSDNGNPGNLDTICCGTDPGSSGFTLIHSTRPPNGIDTTSFVDSDFSPPFEGDICYVVVAYFDFNQKSCPSNVECIELDLENFVVTNDSVNTTDPNGSIFVSWSMPDTSGFNKVFFPEPYTYDLFRANDIVGAANYVQINPAPLSFSDTTFMDNGIDTEVQGYRYKVELHDAISVLNESNNASSIYLTTLGGDQKISLSWSEYVDWDNDLYEIFRADLIGGPYVLVGTVLGTGGNTHTYIDTGLENGKEYCYFIRSHGKYLSIPDVKDSLINDSQRKCDIAEDQTPPCIDSTIFSVDTSCLEMSIHFSWTDVDSFCAGDLDFFTLYRADDIGLPFTQIATIPGNQNSYNLDNLESLADCYGISATDTNGNESDTIIWCFDNCPMFEPSNVFTPNGDGFNDFFNPFRERAVIIRKILIFDRWGHMVYSRDNDIDKTRMWDGKNMNGKEVGEGVYYYVIEYSEDRLGGNIEIPALSGNVTLLR